MLTIQDKIIYLRNKLDYLYSDEGLCAGIGMTAVQAFCLDKALTKINQNIRPTKEFDKYVDRIRFIDLHYKTLADDIKKIRQKIKDGYQNKVKYIPKAAERDILEIAAFIDNLEAYTNAIDHPDLYNTKDSYISAIDTAKFFQQPLFKEQTKLELIDHIMQVYDQHSLELFVETLIQTLETLPTDLSFYIGTGTHRFTICYDKSLKSWRYIDQKHLPPILITDQEIKDTFLSACGAKYSKPMCLSIQSFASANRTDELKQFTETFHHHLAAKGIDTFDPILCNSLNKRGKSITWMAARYNDVKTLEKLAELKDSAGKYAINFSLSNNGVTPFAQAIDDGNFEAIKFFVNLKSENGTREINLNQICKGGEPVLHTLINDDGETIIDYLLSLKHPDGTYEFDLNVVNTMGENIVTYALEEKKFDLAFKFLILKDANGEYIFNSSSFQSKNYPPSSLEMAAINRDRLLSHLKDMMRQFPSNTHFNKIKKDVMKDFEDDWSSFIHVPNTSKYLKRALDEIDSEEPVNKKRQKMSSSANVSHGTNYPKGAIGKKTNKKSHKNFYQQTNLVAKPNSTFRHKKKSQATAAGRTNSKLP